MGKRSRRAGRAGRAGTGGSRSRSKSRAANRALLSCPGQFTAWHCSSGRGGGNRPCYTWEGKPTCFQLSPNRPRDYDGDKSVSAPTLVPGMEAASGRQRPYASQVARVCEHSLQQPTHPPTAGPPVLSQPSASWAPRGMEGKLRKGIPESLQAAQGPAEVQRGGRRPRAPAEAPAYSSSPTKSPALQPPSSGSGASPGSMRTSTSRPRHLLFSLPGGTPSSCPQLPTHPSELSSRDPSL